MDKAELAGDKEQTALNKRLQTIYSDALETALENQKTFLEKMKKLDIEAKALPSDWTDKQVAQWKQGYQVELIRQYKVVNNIAKELASVGGEVTDDIQTMLTSVYGINNKYIIDTVEKAVNVSIQPYSAKQIKVILQETESPFSKLAYKNLSNDSQIVKRLNNELAQATLLGESQKKIIARIQKVTGQTAYQAKRVAQTERVRVQSQARFETTQLAQEKGVKIENEWRAKMKNTRDTHKQANGERRKPKEKFSNGLEFPGDPKGGASEVINCHCVLVPRVTV